jgi:hypothetical protein
MANPGETPSKQFLLGQLRACLRPSRIDLVEVRRLLRAIVASGFNPVELWNEALRTRPDVYDPPPAIVSLLPEDLPREKQWDAALGEVLVKKDIGSKSDESKPSSRETPKED